MVVCLLAMDWQTFQGVSHPQPINAGTGSISSCNPEKNEQWKIQTKDQEHFSNELEVSKLTKVCGPSKAHVGAVTIHVFFD